MRSFFLFIIFLPSYLFACCRTTFVPRSQDDNIARYLRRDQLSVEENNACYTMLVMPSYEHSLRSKKISEHFFGTSCLKFSGSRVENRGVHDLLADYFGLPADFESTVQFRPRIQNLSVDIAGSCNLSWLYEGLFFKLRSQFVHTRWNMRMCEQVKTKGEQFHIAGYLSGGNLRLERTQLPRDVVTVLKGGTTFGDMQDPLQFGKICGTQTKTEVANIKAELVYNLTRNDDYFVAINFFLGVPTGSRITAEYLFEPIVGNGHCWELGGGFSGTYQAWNSDDKKQYCSLFGHLQLSHLFASHQRRSFDLKNGCLSRYMLLTTLDKTHDDILKVPQGVSPALQYTGHLFHAINKTTFDCKVGVAIKADFLIGATYLYHDWSFDVGYNLWIKSSEKLKCRQRLQSGKYGIKGDAQLYGFFVHDGIGGASEIPVSLNSTQSKATIYSGQGDLNTDFTNANDDNPAIAYENATTDPLQVPTAADSVALSIPVNDVNGSNPPILLTDSDIDNCSALTATVSSSSLFTRVSYIFKEREDWVPYFSGGLLCELSHSKGTYSRIGLWLEGGFLY